MDAQSLVVLLVVAAAAFYVLRRAWRTLRASRAANDASCGSGCGCAPSSVQPVEKLGRGGSSSRMAP